MRMLIQQFYYLNFFGWVFLCAFAVRYLKRHGGRGRGVVLVRGKRDEIFQTADYFVGLKVKNGSKALSVASFLPGKLFTRLGARAKAYMPFSLSFGILPQNPNC